MNKGREKELQHWNKLRQNGKTEDADLQGIWDVADQYGRDYEPDVEAGLRKLKHKMAADEGRTAKVVPMSSFRWLRSVAAIGLIGLLTWAGFGLLNNGANTSADWIEVQTAANETRELVLPDGSIITLNENSSLAYEANLNEATTRQVRLQGEAYFDVERRPKQAFTIETNRAEVRVLGTSFNVRALTEESEMEVEVTSGLVAVRALANNEEVKLEAKEAVILNAADQLVEKEAPLLNRQAWRTGELNFRNTPVTEALEAIERYYGVDFNIDVDRALNCGGVTTVLEDVSLLEAIQNIKNNFTSLQINEIEEGRYQVSGQCD